MMVRLIAFLIVSLLSVSACSKTEQAAIATAHPLATEAGFEVLQKGGNAFDAAVAITAALAVVEPAGSGLGGGGFWLLHRADDQHQVMIDGREMAPGLANAVMYLDEQGEFNPELALNGPLAAGIPGVPAALVHLSEHYGQLPLATALEPAINYAQQGFSVTEGYQQLVGFRQHVLQRYPQSAAQFLDAGEVPELGHRIVQPDLAMTLKAIAEQGRDGFYHGSVADKLLKSVNAHGGIWTQSDLDAYQVKERTPVTGHYQGYTITSAALPSSGGIVMMLTLNQLAKFDLQSANKAQQRHWVIEAMRRAYRDRARYLGDSDFVNIPSHLTTAVYAAELAQTIDDNTASRSELLSAIKPAGEDTTHFSVIDQFGNRVAATLSINYPFGSGFVAEGTGVLLNDEMDDFAPPSGKANVYGLVGNQANAIAPYKRPLSSMSPSFIENDDKLMITGTPGGSRIISMVLLSMLDFIEGKSAAEIVSAPRYHHQFLPDEVHIEQTGFSEADIADLQQRGHKVNQLTRQYGDMQTLIVDKHSKQIDAASDPRGEGLAEVRAIHH